jgi:hypothetical protein
VRSHVVHTKPSQFRNLTGTAGWRKNGTGERANSGAAGR